MHKTVLIINRIAVYLKLTQISPNESGFVVDAHRYDISTLPVQRNRQVGNLVRL